MKKQIGVTILTMLITGFITLSATSYQDVVNLKAEQESIKDKISSIDKKVNEIHWFLIKKD